MNFETSAFNSYLVILLLIVLGLVVEHYIIGVSIFILLANELLHNHLSNPKLERINPLIKIGLFSLSTFMYLYYLLRFNFINFDLNFLIFLSLLGGISSALIKSIETENDDRVTLITSAFTVFLIFSIYGISANLKELLMAFLLSFGLSLTAMRAGVADESGLLSATLIGTLIIVFTDIRFFLILLSFYIIGSLATKYKYSQKELLGVGEPAGGARGYSNVFANSLPALFFAMNYGVYGYEIFLLSFIASISCALGDTMASEIGKTSRDVYLITDFSKVIPGESGGISIKGEVSAFLGCLIVSVLAFLLGIIPAKDVFIPLLAGFIAVHVDSILGATLEKMGHLSNSGVNFLATSSVIVFCYFLLL
jgi:uncharacterized protein (TIGR00297 family)